MGKCLFMRKGETHTAPKKPGIALADIAVGSLVKLNESGSPVEFYVAKHNYESSLNGTGRTLLVRKDCCNNVMAYSDYYGAYSKSALDSWLNNTYKSRLDVAVRDAISTTKFYCSYGGGYGGGMSLSAVTTLSKAVFSPSATEISLSTYGNFNAEGSKLSVANAIAIAYCNGSKVGYWTRSSSSYAEDRSIFVSTEGQAVETSCTSYNTKYPRPCFTLPANTLFNAETMEFLGVA